jgi:hypothetical protein
MATRGDVLGALFSVADEAAQSGGSVSMQGRIPRLGAVALLAGVTGLASVLQSHAAERATGVYLLGFRGPMAGYTPPPGIFLQNDVYFYSGSAEASRSLPFGGQLIADVEATAILELPTGVWVTEADIFGGNLAFSVTLPIGSQDIDASIGPLAVSDGIFTVGDPFITTFVGWHAGNFHWQLGVGVNTPVGDYQKGEIANIAFNRWAADLFGTATWLDPTIGLDVSGAMGFTFNGENPTTNYQTGTEFHLEGAIVQNFSPQFSIGAVGYYYNQITGDSGSGAVLGDFKGEVVALGATMGFNFQIGVLPVSTRLKYFHEFDATNRLEGDAGYITVAIPLWVPQPPPAQ